MTQETKRSAKGELVFTSFLFLAGLVVLWDASQLPELAIADFVGSKLFPSIIGWMLVIFAAIQLGAVLRGKLGEPEDIEGGKADSKIHLKKFALIFSGLLAFALLINVAGFIVSAILLFTAVVYALNPKKTRWFVAVPIAIAVSLVIYFGFTEGLQINLPWGFDLNFGTTEVVVEEEW